VQITAVPSSIGRIIYGCYAWTVLFVVIVPVIISLALTPGVVRRRNIARWGARAIFVLIGSPVRVVGHGSPQYGSCVVVANHGSYLDGIILTAVLPAQFTFLIKREMATLPIVGFVLKRLGSEFVDREHAPDRHRMARRLVGAALNGNALAMFPEGTFDARRGLKKFQIGAFAAAWRAELNVVPTVILGARHKLQSGAALPRPGPLTVHICEPLHAPAYDTPESLMQASRQAILKHLDEPDLAGM